MNHGIYLPGCSLILSKHMSITQLLKENISPWIRPLKRLHIPCGQLLSLRNQFSLSGPSQIVIPSSSGQNPCFHLVFPVGFFGPTYRAPIDHENMILQHCLVFGVMFLLMLCFLDRKHDYIIESKQYGTLNYQISFDIIG